MSTLGQVGRFTTADGDAGTVSTLRVMAAIAREASRNSDTMHRLAAMIAGQARNRDQVDQLRQVYRFALRAFNFKRDTWGTEHVRLPDDVADDLVASPEHRVGIDCDDVATFLATLILSLGIRAGFAVVGRQQGGPFEHVFAIAETAHGRVVPLDPQERVPFGEWPPGVARRRVVWIR